MKTLDTLKAVLAGSIVALVTAGTMPAFAGTHDDGQAPRGLTTEINGTYDDGQAPRGQDLQAPRGQDLQAPRGQDLQAPRGTRS